MRLYEPWGEQLECSYLINQHGVEKKDWALLYETEINSNLVLLHPMTTA